MLAAMPLATISNKKTGVNSNPILQPLLDRLPHPVTFVKCFTKSVQKKPGELPGSRANECDNTQQVTIVARGTSAVRASRHSPQTTTALGGSGVRSLYGRKTHRQRASDFLSPAQSQSGCAEWGAHSSTAGAAGALRFERLLEGDFSESMLPSSVLRARSSTSLGRRCERLDPRDTPDRGGAGGMRLVLFSSPAFSEDPRGPSALARPPARPRGAALSVPSSGDSASAPRRLEL